MLKVSPAAYDNPSPLSDENDFTKALPPLPLALYVIVVVDADLFLNTVRV
jgi:hypothetical protein